MSPTFERYPENPSLFTSGRPPEFVEITGTDEAIASRATRPKLSVVDANINTSLKYNILAVSFDAPKNKTFSFKFNSSQSFSAFILSGPSPNNINFELILLLIRLYEFMTSSILFTFLKLLI